MSIGWKLSPVMTVLDGMKGVCVTHREKNAFNMMSEFHTPICGYVVEAQVKVPNLSVFYDLQQVRGPSVEGQTKVFASLLARYFVDSWLASLEVRVVKAQNRVEGIVCSICKTTMDNTPCCDGGMQCIER